MRDVAVTFGGPPLFAGIELHMARGDRAALVGRNGSGKSTLMKAIAGAIELDRGEIYSEPGLALGWLEQEPHLPPALTVHEYVAAGAQPEHLVSAVLAEVGLDGAREMATLSGGETRRAGLARVFAAPPDLLLLDEPTNHLDLAMIEWLEARLLAYRGALIVISHDRAFLANVTNRIFWLDRGRLRTAERGFAAFEDWREEVLRAEERALERLDTKLAAEAHWLIYGITARRRRNQGRLARLEAMRAQRATLIGGRAKMKLAAKEGESRSRMVIEATGIAKSVPALRSLVPAGERTLIKDFSTLILRSDRIGIVGPNGAGKSTLIRMLVGEFEPDRGRVQMAKNLSLAYFDQKREQLDPKLSLKDVLCPQGGDTVFVQGRPKNVRGYLKEFLFDPRQADSPTGTLSGGERNRLLLAKILATPADLLVLDEPTNDLDTDTLDLLEELLGDYAGTLLVVSHDRDFLDKTVSSVIVMPGDGTATEYAGGFSDAMAQRKGPARAAKPAAKPAAAPARTDDGIRPTRAQVRLSYKDQRELDLLPDRIAALESEIADLEALLADAGIYARDPALAERTMRRHSAARTELGELEHRWLELEERRSSLERGVGALKRDADER
jgi:ATP-binding cassette subfamily F protein uup